ncbi:MAG: ABC transporter permease [Gemmobacter sp.]|nr:ABC transporter permease [Gemmobacter sp.]
MSPLLAVTSVVLRRLGTASLQLLAVASLVFAMLFLLPGDPVMILLGQESNPAPEAVAALREKLGLDRPIAVQYFDWLWGVVQGDFGRSLANDYPVADYIAQTLPRTLELAVAAILVAVLIGLPVGIAAALRRGTWADSLLTSATTLGISVPVYILGAILILIFAQGLNWLPASGYTDLSRNPLEHFRKLVLPGVTLGLGLAASIARMTRASMLEILGRDFVRTLRAKGMGETQIIWQHVLRSAAIPIVTIVGLQLGNLLGGTVLVEALFNWPGLATMLVKAVGDRDYPMVQGAILTIAAAFILINLAVELIYSLLDPRIRRRRQ